MLGYFFANQIQQITDAMANMGGKALGLLAGLLGACIGIKVWQRQWILRELPTARITVSDPRRKQESVEQLIILDLRFSAFRNKPTIVKSANPVVLLVLKSRLTQ